MRNADWVTMENRHEAWHSFKEWCKEKYGSTLVDAYTAFFWLTDPEYYIAPKVDENVSKSPSDVLDEIIDLCSKYLNSKCYSESPSLYEFCHVVAGEAACYRNRMPIECFDAILKRIVYEKDCCRFNENTEHGKFILDIEKKAQAGFNMVDESSKHESSELDPYITAIQVKCMEKMTKDIYQFNNQMYRWASTVLYVIANSKAQKEEGGIFKKLRDMAVDIALNSKTRKNLALVELAREIREIACDGWFKKNPPPDAEKQKTKVERIADRTSAILQAIGKAAPSVLSKNGYSMLLSAVYDIDSICKENGGA